MDSYEEVDLDLDPQEIVESPDVLADLPTDQALDHELDTELQISTAAERLNNIADLNPETWDNLEAQEKLNTLQSVEDTMAEIQQRPTVPITMASMESNVFGGYDPSTGGIAVNADHLASDMPLAECVNTIVHEGRHAYQDFAIQNPESVADPAVVEAWAENAQNYLDPSIVGQELYETQPMEADAFSYADRIAGMLNR